VVLEDYKNSLRALKPGGLIVFDDSSVYTDYQPPGFPFKGHPGPSQIVRDYAMKEMCFLGGVGHNNVFQKR
jgi:predicted O-methyltransferase YrrM